MPGKESDEEYAKRILAKSEKYLAQVDEAFILKQRGHSERAMPTFRPEEISLGAVLGMGGFGVVNEIIKFTLDPNAGDDELDQTLDKNQNGQNANGADKSGNGGGNNNNNDDDNDDDDDDDDHDDHHHHQEAPMVEIVVGRDSEAPTEELGEDNDEDTPGPTQAVSNLATVSERGAHDFHYDVTQARKLMEKRAIRSGKARYALKRLHSDLTVLERARGMIDLAVEAKYLSIVWHPNIIKMRGMARGPMVDQDFFIILDRLVETLDKRMNRWFTVHRKYRTAICGCGKYKKIVEEMVLETMTIAYDLAAAFFYLHENRLVYRDIKPENIGFDTRGDVKVFDFGLCKNLSPSLKAKGGGYGYRLTGRAGSLPYMAPEVAKMQGYDTKCDVFSFAILLWEMLSCKPAFDDYSSLEYMNKVVTEEERLPVDKSWPPLTRLMIPEAWDTDPRKRPDMKRVAIMIRGDLNDLTTDDRILHRTRHLAARSQHSINEEIIPLATKKYS